MSTESANDFYDALAPWFDLMTDWDARLAAEGPFLRHQLEAAGARKVLDVGCGSGGHTLALAQWGYQATGCDPAPQMVALAEAKQKRAAAIAPGAAAAAAARFCVAGLADLPRAFEPASFDAVLCLGNTLPHLLSSEELAGALRGAAEVLVAGGILITQNLNYDLRWRTKPRFFAAQGGLMEGQEALVWRFADYDEPAFRIQFHTALFRQAGSGWQVQVHTTLQRPWGQAELARILTECGLVTRASYGQMAWPPPPFAADSSGDLVLVAAREQKA